MSNNSTFTAKGKTTTLAMQKQASIQWEKVSNDDEC